MEGSALNPIVRESALFVAAAELLAPEAVPELVLLPQPPIEITIAADSTPAANFTHNLLFIF
ncbi:protein of unknown function [Ruminococcaceae bacterium BL-4]|nr:protein of unknown function [Ruminococcaceae bacterium BL-4]